MNIAPITATSSLTMRERAPISLEELQLTASYLVRRDRKYIVSTQTLGPILAAINAEARVLEINGQRVFTYESLYFDTDDLQSYYRSLRQRPDRFKVRVRVYTDSGLSFLEAKTHDHHGRTVKQRMDRCGVAEPELDPGEQEWLRHLHEIGTSATRLSHMVTTRYSRTTLVLPNGEGRVTIDHNLEFSAPDGDTVAVPSIVILESKGAGHPTSVDYILWRHGIRPVSISKFGCGMSLLTEDLPSNRWHRVRNMLENSALRDRGNIREVSGVIERV